MRLLLQAKVSWVYLGCNLLTQQMQIHAALLALDIFGLCMLVPAMHSSRCRCRWDYCVRPLCSLLSFTRAECGKPQWWLKVLLVTPGFSCTTSIPSTLFCPFRFFFAGGVFFSLSFFAPPSSFWKLLWEPSTNLLKLHQRGNGGKSIIDFAFCQTQI